MLFPLVPVPFIDLTFLESKLVWKFRNCSFVPVRIFIEKLQKNSVLVKILSLSLLLVLRLCGRIMSYDLLNGFLKFWFFFSKQEIYTLIQIIWVKDIINDNSIDFKLLKRVFFHVFCWVSAVFIFSILRVISRIHVLIAIWAESSWARSFYGWFIKRGILK